MECVELAPAVGCVVRIESGSKLHALHTLRAVRTLWPGAPYLQRRPPGCLGLASRWEPVVRSLDLQRDLDQVFSLSQTARPAPWALATRRRSPPGRGS